MVTLLNLMELKAQITGQTGNNRAKSVELMVQLKHLSNFWRTLEMPLFTCEINLILTRFANCVIVLTDAVNQGATLAITETKRYVPVVINQVKIMQSYCSY